MVCVSYQLNVRSTMEIRRSHLCDYFLVLPFFITSVLYEIMIIIVNIVNKIYQQQQQHYSDQNKTIQFGMR